MAEQEHWAKVVYQPDLLDTVECSCGWKSRVYYDGREFAYAEWQKHAKSFTSANSEKE